LKEALDLSLDRLLDDDDDDVGNVGQDLGGKVDKIYLAQTIRTGWGVSSALTEGKSAGTRTCPLPIL
jgi:hypothetical protein